MLNQFSRTQLLLGRESIERLQNARVAVFGIGGVGGYVCEALVLNKNKNLNCFTAVKVLYFSRVECISKCRTSRIP